MEALSDPKAKFHKSLIQHTIDLCELLPKMNITGDAELDAMRLEIIKRLTKESAEDLRTNAKARETVAKAAKGILARIDKRRRPAKAA